MKNEVGLKHIAIELGVSLTTVSRALSDADDISEAMKAKVRRKAIELKYTPNQFAKSLSTGKSNIIAIFVDSLVSPYFSLVVEMMVRKLNAKGYTVSLFPINHAYTQKEDIKTVIAAGVAAIITFMVPKQDAIETANLSSRPLLLFGRGCDSPNVNVIYTDDVDGGYLAAKHLHEKGHDKLMYLHGGVDEVSSYRLKGMTQYCQEKSISFEAVDIVKNATAPLELLEKGYDGVFAFDDQLASQFLWNNKSKKIDIIGFNGLRQFPTMPVDYASFPSIAGDYEAMVSEAVDIVIDQIKSDPNVCIKRKYPVRIIG